MPCIERFERSKGLTMDTAIKQPMCYGTVAEDVNECIILEDLRAHEFEMIDRFTDEVTVDHVRLVMQLLEKFHANSFALKDQQSQQFNEITSNLSELYIRQNDKTSRDYFNLMANSVLDALSSDEDTLIRSKITELFKKDAIDIAADCVAAKSIEPTAIITHGDICQNNIMFKYDECGKPSEARFLDWQMARYSSPVLDVVYFIFCCTTKQLRNAHYDELLHIYHASKSMLSAEKIPLGN